MIVRAGLVAAAMAIVGSLGAIADWRASNEPVATVSPEALDGLLPERFGVWRPARLGLVIAPAETPKGVRVAYRAYEDKAGRVITVAVVHGGGIEGDVRVHRPEQCYRAQGYRVQNRKRLDVLTNRGVVNAVMVQTRNPIRSETVSYWMRAGERFVIGPVGLLRARIDRDETRRDNALVRISSPAVLGPDDAMEFHARFIQAFTDAMNPKARALLLPEGAG